MTFLVMVLTMTAGTAVIMWLGELITERGIGNGMSILIFTQVVATFPAALWSVEKTKGWWTFAHRDRDRTRDRGRRSSSSNRRSAGSRCSTPAGWSAARCSAAARPTSR